MVTLPTNCSDSLGTYSFKSCIRTEAMVLSPVLTQYDKGEFFFTMVNGPSQLSSNLVLRPDFLMYTFCPFSNSLIFDFASQVCFLLAELCLKLATASSLNFWTLSVFIATHSSRSICPRSPWTHPLYKSWSGEVGSQPCLIKKGLRPVDLWVYSGGNIEPWVKPEANFLLLLCFWRLLS